MCRRDHVVIAEGGPDKFCLLVTPSSDSGMDDDHSKVKRRHLFRFEALEGPDQQWAIRSSGGSHLAVNHKGNLIVMVRNDNVVTVHSDCFRTVQSKQCVDHCKAMSLTAGRPV